MAPIKSSCAASSGVVGFSLYSNSHVFGDSVSFCHPFKTSRCQNSGRSSDRCFFQHGYPCRVLHDQGTIFVGKVTKTLCELVNVKQIKTTAYHPQTNGILERWHVCLKDMLRKQEEGPREWDCLLKYCLLANPTLSYIVFPIRAGPWQAAQRPLASPEGRGWTGGELKFETSIDWVNQLRDTLSQLQKVTYDNEEKFKEGTKKVYDRGTVKRDYKPGDMVLLHTPSLSGSLSTVWEGPYEVMQVLSPTTYKLSVPGKRKHTLTTHVNHLKDWKIPQANILSVVMARDSPGSDGPVGAVQLSEPKLEPAQEAEMQALLKQFKHVVCEKLGKTSSVTHTIDTRPVQVHPYRIAPAWREELRQEIFSLRDEGTINYSQSPWSAPMVPVCKLMSRSGFALTFMG